MKHVNKKLFSQEEMDQLSSNKYVKAVYPSTVRFTEEFKQYFLDRRSEGVTSTQILLFSAKSG